MDRINGADTVDIGGGKRGFRAENLVAGVAGTEVTADWLNSVQEELLRVVTEAGIVPNAGDWSQLWQALKGMGLSSGSRSRRWMAVVSITLSSAPGAPVEGDAYLIPVGATGIWAAQVGKIAEWTGSSWTYFNPTDGHGIALPDGRVFERIGGSYVEKLAIDAQSGKWSYAQAAGTANALTATLVPNPGSPSIGMVVCIKITTTNTGAATLDVNGSGAKPITRLGGSSLLKNDLPAGAMMKFGYDGAKWQVLNLNPQRRANQALFDAVGLTSWTVPDGVYQIFGRVWDGGGGGGGGFNAAGVYAGEGGAGGGYSEGWFTVTPGQVIPITVGSGGQGGAPGQPGTNGGTSSLGSYCSATGGQAGRFADMASTFARTGGSGTGGDLNMSGGFGNVIVPSGTSAAIGGAGGDSPMGGAGACNTPTGPALGLVPGGGGGGAAGAGGLSGASGARGRVIIEY